jgi:hypothetical protein
MKFATLALKSVFSLVSDDERNEWFGVTHKTPNPKIP